MSEPPVSEHPVAQTLTAEHRDIDRAIEAFVADVQAGTMTPAAIGTTLDLLRRHIWLEEEILFPPIAQAGLAMPIHVMLMEHGELWGLMDTLQAQADAGDDGILATCESLLALLERHNMKEEPVIYGRIPADLEPEQLDALDEGLAAGSVMPSGWTCTRAPR